MSFLQNVKINNLIRDVNDLQAQVQELITTGTAPIIGDLVMDGHDVVEVGAVSLGASNTVTLQPYSGNTSLLDVSGGINAGGDIFVNNNDLKNVDNIVFYGSTNNLTLVSGNLKYGNDTILMTDPSGNMDMNTGSVLNASSLEFANGTQITSAIGSPPITYTLFQTTTREGNTFTCHTNTFSTGLFFKSDQSLQDSTLSSTISIPSPMDNTSLDFGISALSNATDIQYGFSVYQNALRLVSNGSFIATIAYTEDMDVAINVSSTTLTYYVNGVAQTNNIVTLPTESAYYVVCSGFPSTTPVVSNVTFVENSALQYDNEVVLTQNNYNTYMTFPPSTFVATATQNLEMAGYDIGSINTLNFNSAQTELYVDSNDDLLFNSHVVITSDNIGDYFVSTATENLDMQNHQINNVSALNFGSSNEINVSSSNLQYNDSIVITADNIASYVESINWTGEATSALEMNDYDINQINTAQFKHTVVLSETEDFENLAVNQNKVITSVQDIVDSETRELTEYQPTNSLPMTNIALVGNTTSPITITDNYYIQTPCRMNLDLDFTITGDTPITLNANNVYMIVGLCNNHVYVNSDLQIDFLKIDGTAINYENGHYTSLINLIMQNGANSDNVILQGGVTLIESMVDIVAQWQAQANFNPIADIYAYYYVKLFGQIGSTQTYLSTFAGTVKIASGTYDLDYKFGVQQSAIPNYITPLNTYQNTFISLCQYVENFTQANGSNTLLTLIIPAQTGSNGCNVLVTASIVSVWYTIKFTSVVNITASATTIVSGSPNIIHMFNPHNVLQSASLFIDSDNSVSIVNQITTGSGPTYSINNCSVKAKLQIINY